MTPEELAGRLDPAGEFYAGLKVKLTRGAAEVLWRHLQETTPVRTGDLQRSEVIDPVGTGDWAQIFILAPYADFVDSGTVHMAPRHYVQAAIDASAADVDTLLATEGEAFVAAVAAL